MSKTTKQIRHMFNLGVAILFTGFVFAIGADDELVFKKDVPVKRDFIVR